MGTFIGISSGLSLKMSQGKKIGFADIFDGRYRELVLKQEENQADDVEKLDLDEF